MRVGVNPLRHSVAPVNAPDVVAAVITHLPELTGYHKERLAIVKACLNSMRDNAGIRCSILVWDNGSCEALKEWLRDHYHAQFQMWGPNIGKSSAKAAILRMFPPETIVGISDDDMLFYPGWLDEQVKLACAFPNVGTVTGYPCRSMMQHNESTLAWARTCGEAKIETGQFIPDEWEIDYAVSTGMDPQSWLAEIKKKQDTRIEYRGMKAYATSHHCQAIYPAGQVAPLTAWDKMATAGELVWDEAIDRAGLLRLATVDRLSEHMGNHIDPKLEGKLKEMGLL